MRLRVKIALWLLGKLGPDEVYAVVGRNLGRLDSFLLLRLAKDACCKMTHHDRGDLMSWLGRGLNIEKDGRLDLGRSKEGN